MHEFATARVGRVGGSMLACLSRHHLPTVRHGHDRAGRQRFLCRQCHRTFTADSATAFCGYHWPAEVVLMAVRWYLAHPLSSTSVMVLLAVRGIDASPRTVLRWVQTFGPLLADEVRKHRRRTVLHRARGETTTSIERSHIPTRDHLRASRGRKTTATGRRFFQGFEALPALARGHLPLEGLMPGYSSAGATAHERERAVASAVTMRGTRLHRAA